MKRDLAAEDFEAERKRQADREEERRKFPHKDMEAAYQNKGMWFILSGSDQMPFGKSQFFAGFNFNLLGQRPKWVSANDGMIDPIIYLSREAAHAAMTELINWYETEGVRLGIRKPADLTIGY